MQVKINEPKKFVIVFEQIFIKIFPNHIAMKVVKKEIKNNITLALLEILVFFKPYVIPIPRESILLEKAKNNVFISIYTSIVYYAKKVEKVIFKVLIFNNVIIYLSFLDCFTLFLRI